MRIPFPGVFGLLAAVSLSGCRWQETNAHHNQKKTRATAYLGADRIHESTRKTGAIPIQATSPGAAEAPVPDGIYWSDIIDATNPFEKEPIRYWTGGDAGWILDAMGPDKDHDFRKEDWMFDPAAATDERWLKLNYDPTNGILSGGDIMVASWQTPPVPTPSVRRSHR